MLLAVDVGNTNVVFALFGDETDGAGDAGVAGAGGEEGTPIRARWRIATDPRRTADEYAVWLFQLMQIEGFAPAQVTAMMVASVVPRTRHNLDVLARKYFSVVPLFAGEGEAGWGIAIDVDEPRSLGADRAVNAIAAHARYAGDLIVVDFGTATTFDVVDYTGAYKGGIIAPGINLSLDALVNNTAKLPRIAIEVPRTTSVVGRNTEDQMQIGVFWGYVALMEGLIERLRGEIGRPARVIATGGLALLFDRHTPIFDAVDTDLTLTGLALMARREELN